MDTTIIEKKMEELPPELQQEVVHFIEFLISKNKRNNGRVNTEKFSFKWAEGLSDLKNKYTSVELQHKSMDWR